MQLLSIFFSCLSYVSALWLCLIPHCVILFAFGYLRYASLRHAFLRDDCLRYGYLRDTYLRYGYLRYGFLRYASFRDGHLQNRLVAIQLWIDAFMIWTILFQILTVEFCHKYTSIQTIR